MKRSGIFYRLICCENKYRRCLCIIIVALACFACKSTKAQDVTLTVQNAELKIVLKKIRSQIRYDFITTEEALKKAKPVTLNVNKVDLKKVLAVITKDTPLKYEIVNKTIVITAEAQ